MVINFLRRRREKLDERADLEQMASEAPPYVLSEMTAYYGLRWGEDKWLRQYKNEYMSKGE